MNGKLRTDLGQELDALVSLSQIGDRFQLVFESSGESGRRNGDYREAFELAVKRLAELDAVLHDGRVESRTTRTFSATQKRLYVEASRYPIRLSRITDLPKFAKDLRAAGAKVGRVSDHGGNPTKRIALEFSLPAATHSDLDALAGNLLGTSRKSGATSVPPPDVKLHTWWKARRGENYWLEITGRQDLGADLRAPQTNEHGERYWSYNLLHYVEPGDLVFHYHRDSSAIVAVSRATETQWPDETIWAARGTSARNAGVQPHTRPGWYVGLDSFRKLAKPVTLEQIRSSSPTLSNEIETLRRSAGHPLYFPFELSKSRELRPMQGYLFKLPRFFVEIFPELSATLKAPNPVRRASRPAPAPYRRADENSNVARSDPFSIDPAIKERALRSHAATQNVLADFLKSHGLNPQSAISSQLNYDVAWEFKKTFWVAEVKSITDGNEEKQLRLGLGQVLRYRQVSDGSRPTRAALVTERKPRDPSWIELCRSLNVVLTWPGDLEVLLD